MSFGEAIKSVFSNYANFKGRARRSEYWYFVLFNFLFSTLLSLLTLISQKLIVINYLYTLVVFIPALAVTVRRLHDIGKSGWNYLILLATIILLSVTSFILTDTLFARRRLSGSSTLTEVLLVITSLTIIAIVITFFVWMCRDSEPGTNKWGPNPKEQTTDNTNQY